MGTELEEMIDLFDQNMEITDEICALCGTQLVLKGGIPTCDYCGGKELDVKNLLHRKRFKNPSALDHSYIPAKLQFRRDAFMKLIMNFRDVINDKTIFRPAVITGPIGCGKTALAKFFAKRFKDVVIEHIPEFKVHYINCSVCRSLHAMFRALHYTSRGYSNDENLKNFIQKARIHDAHVLLILDEVQDLDRDDLLQLLNISEAFGHHNVRVSLLMVCRKRDWRGIADERILSRSMLEIELEAYTYKQVRMILREREETAFGQQLLTEEAMILLARRCHENENIRHGIEALRHGALLMEQEVQSCITTRLIEKALESSYTQFRPFFDTLRLHELIALTAIIQTRKQLDDSFTTESIYEQYTKLCENNAIRPHVKISFRRYLCVLKDRSVIDATCKKLEESRGRHNVYTLKMTELEHSFMYLQHYLNQRITQEVKR